MDLSYSLQLAAVAAGFAAIGFLAGTRMRFSSSSASISEASPEEDSEVSHESLKNRKPKLKQRHEVDRMADIMDDFKMVLVVRNDLKMGKGKIAAQCSHATLGLYKKIFNRAPKALERWENCGQVKVVTKIESEDEMLLLQAKANSLKVASHITIDAGRTQIAPNSRTVMALLGPADIIDEVTGSLKLL